MMDMLRRLLNKEFFSLDVSLQKEGYAAFYHLLYGVAMRIAKDHVTAEDVVQEALLKALCHPPVVETEAQFMAWIKVVARNLTINAIRKRNKFHFIEDFEAISARLSSGNEATIEEAIETKLLVEDVRERLREMNPAYQKLIEWKWNGKTNREIACAFELTEGAVKQKLHRAREALRKKLYKNSGFRVMDL